MNTTEETSVTAINWMNEYPISVDRGGCLCAIVKNILETTFKFVIYGLKMNMLVNFPNDFSLVSQIAFATIQNNNYSLK